MKVTKRTTFGLDDVEHINLLMAARNAGKDWRLAVGYRIEPLSGTWAGESMVEISERYDLDLFDSDLADEFELGFFHEDE